MNLNKIFKGGIDINAVAKITILTIAGVVMYRLVRSRQKNMAILTESVAGATLSDTQIAGIATKIESAWGVFNDDETAVYNAFQMLGNKQDLVKLMRKYYYKGETLQQSISKRMNAREINKINQILKAKGIEYAF